LSMDRCDVLGGGSVSLVLGLPIPSMGKAIYGYTVYRSYPATPGTAH
jgi:hypothetical protein